MSVFISAVLFISSYIYIELELACTDCENELINFQKICKSVVKNNY